MSFRRFIALLCLIAGSFGSGTVAALDCTITMGRSCQGVDSVFYIDAQFPLDNRNHLVIANRGAAQCRLNVVSGTNPSLDPSLGRVMTIPGRGALDFYNPGYYVLAPESQCDLSIRGEQNSPLSPSPPSTFDVACPPTGSYNYGQTVGDSWRIWIQSGKTATVSQWHKLTSARGRGVPETTEIACVTHGQPLVTAIKVIPGNFSCYGVADVDVSNRHSGPLQGTCWRQ